MMVGMVGSASRPPVPLLPRGTANKNRNRYGRGALCFYERLFKFLQNCIKIPPALSGTPIIEEGGWSEK